MMKRLKTVIYGAAVAGLCLSQVSGVYASGLSQTTMNTFWAEGETVLETETSESSTELESETASDPQTQESESVPETEAPESESVPETEVPESESVLQTEAPESESVPETEVPESESVPETEDPEPIKDGFVHEDGHTYYYQNGVMLKNKELYDKNNWYYFDHTGKMATGWTKHHNKQYYYDKDGRMVHGIYEIEGKKYGFDEWSGVLLTGEHLFTDKNDGYWYYFYEKDDSKHKKGEMAVGWVKHHSKQYYYDENGVMVHHIVKIDGKYYGFNEWTGVLLTGEHYFTDGSSDQWYYFYDVSQDGKVKGEMATGWTAHHNNKYYYNDKGQMVHGPHEIDGQLYMFDEWLGTIRTGWLPYHNEWYYMDQMGVIQRGELQLDGHWYYFDEKTGITANKGLTYHHNHWYYYNENGHMQYGEKYVDGGWRYFNEYTGVMAIGWTKHHGNTYYYDGGGKMVHGKQTIDDRDYYFDNITGILTGVDRAYQNPSQYYQIQDSISLSGGGYNLSIGYEGLKVAYVMRALGMGQGVGMPASGGAYYSVTVANRVKAFQSGCGLPATGIVDIYTWKALGYSESDWYNLGAYVSPLRINKDSTRSDCIEAMIQTAYGYLGTDYIVGAAGAPGTGIDCSGLVMQALYGAGIDMSPINPIRHSYPGYEYESRNIFSSPKLKTVSYGERQRGDLIFYSNGNGVIIHVAIYLGNNQVIEAWPNKVVVWPIVNGQRSIIAGVRRPFV